MKIINNIKGCYRHIPYTIKHYFAFLKVEKKLIGKVVYWHHDWDKLFKFIFLPWLGEEKINNSHRKHQNHHFTYWENDELKKKSQISEDAIIEAIIDWECARFTKPDKPLNARETLDKYYPEYSSLVKPYLTNLGL